MTEIVLRVPGRTSGKARQRFDPRTKRAYSPPSNIVDENDIRSVWREAGEPRLPDDVAIEILLYIWVVRPQGHFKRDGSLSAEGLRHPVPRNKKPDVDNALKTVMDALNTRAYHDDVRVAAVRIERYWADWALTEIVLRPYLGPAPVTILPTAVEVQQTLLAV